MENVRMIGCRGPGGLFSNLRQLWTRRGLLAALIFREVRLRTLGTALGMLWIVIEPALLVAFYTFLFGIVFRTRLPSLTAPETSRFGYAIFVLGGLVPWLAFSNGLLGASRSIVQNKAIITKVLFPIEVLPVAAVVGAQIAFVAMTIIVAIIAAFTNGPSIHLLWLPILALLIILYSLGVGYLLALMCTFFKDISNLLPFVLTLWLYASPVVFAPDAVPARLRPYLAINPIAPIIEAYRSAVVYGRAPEASALMISALIGVVVFLFGFWMFRRAQALFVEVL